MTSYTRPGRMGPTPREDDAAAEYARKHNLGRLIGPASKPYCLTCGVFGHFDADCPVRNRKAPGPDDDQHRSLDP